MAELTKFDEWLTTMTKNGGSARPNRFECVLNLPSTILENTSTEMPRDMVYRITGCSFPGKNIRTTTDENAYGPTYEVAQGITYGEEINLEFLLRSNHEERWLFTSWQDFIVSPTTYDLSYHTEYVADIDIFQLNEQGYRTAGIKIKQCFPKTINAVEYNMNSASEIIKSTVGFSFREWIPLMPQGDATLGKATWVEYPEYKERVVTKRGNPLGMSGPSGTQFPTGNRPVAAAFNDKFPGRQKGIFEDAGKAFNDVLEARDKVVFAQQKVLAFRNFFRGITKNPISNLGIGKFHRF